MTTDQRWARLVALAGDPAITADRQALLQDVVTLGLDGVVPGVRGCSVSETEPAGGRSAAVSNALAADLDQAQFEAGDGPCLLAARLQRPLRLDRIGDQDGFFPFATAAGRLGVLSSLSLPVPGAARPTSLNLYAGRAGAFTGERSQAIAGLLARCAAAALLTASQAAPGTATGLQVPAANLVEALTRRDLLLEAERQLAARDGVTEPEAFRLLAGWSQRERCSIFEVARKVLDGHPGPRAEAARGHSAPGQTAPGQTAPGQTAPGQTAPGQTAPGHAAPQDDATHQENR